MPATLLGARDIKQDTVLGVIILVFLRETDNKLVKKKQISEQRMLPGIKKFTSS